MTNRPNWFAAGLGVLVSLPLLFILVSALRSALDLPAWLALAQDPQTGHALLLSVWSAIASTALSIGICAWILSRSFPHPLWSRLTRLLAPMLAVPHAAFAIGLVFLISPSGWVLRVLSPWATGLSAPPPWVTTQDPWALGLILALVSKEVPFLLWAAASQLQRPDVALRWTRELQLARSIGYNPHRAWWRVLWPQLWPRLQWPMLAVLAYSMTVVDLAQIIGPGSPPTLSVLAWSWLLDADGASNAQGAAAAWALACTLAATAGLGLALGHWKRRRLRWTTGERGTVGSTRAGLWGPLAVGLLLLLYLVVMLALAVGSVSGVWPFPTVLPDNYSLGAWMSVWNSAATSGTTLSLGLAGSATALVWSVAWLEAAPARWDAALRRLVYLPLILPSVLWVVGLHATTLALGIDARWSGLWLAHCLACTPYVLIALSPAYTGFDPRLQLVVASLGHGRLHFLWRVKWPMLRAAIASAFAVGFAISVAQYLPT
ncbi:MAG: ABC transporter permease, partial [Burkholderiaceae bacterium]